MLPTVCFSICPMPADSRSVPAAQCALFLELWSIHRAMKLD
jgi:hypothetical protein